MIFLSKDNFHLRLLRFKTKGFSLVEVLFNMILITLIISCGYLAWQYSFSDLLLFDKANAAMGEYVQFRNALATDAEKYSEMHAAGEEITFKNDSGGVHYFIREHAVVRLINEQADTFHLEISGIKIFLGKEEISAGLADKAELSVVCGDKKLFTVLTKHYDAFTKMELKEKHENGN